MVKKLRSFAALACAAAVAATGCSKRTSAATQTTPKAFEPAKSDPKAVAAIDKMMTALGGYPAWDGAKQIRFELKYKNDGQVQRWFKHSWDKWNGRHRFEHVDMATLAEAEKEGDPSMVRSLVVMYDLFNRGSGYATYGGQELGSDEKKKRIGEAYDRWLEDSYKLAFPYKLKDPGVILKYEQEITPIGETICAPKCHIIEIKFVDGVGTDTYYVGINSNSNMPELMQKKTPAGRLGFGLGGWTDVGGLKFATKLQNLGVEGEIFEFSNIEVGEPEDTLYIPTVR
jgi:hypothetical protein